MKKNKIFHHVITIIGLGKNGIRYENKWLFKNHVRKYDKYKDVYYLELTKEEFKEIKIKLIRFMLN